MSNKSNTKPFKTYPLHLSHDDHAKFAEAAKKEGKTLVDFFLDAIRKEVARVNEE